MSTPTVSASLDKSSYSPGETATLTVTYGDADTETMTVTVVVTDAEGNSSNPAQVTAVVDPLTITVSDDSGRTWAQQSDSGSVAVYTTTV